MAKFYPRSQTFFICIVCAILLGSLLVYTRSHSGQSVAAKPLENANQVAASVAKSGTITGKLAEEWQKQFLTDSNSSIELKVKPSPTNKTATADKTLTDDMSRQFFTRYMDLKQKGMEDNDQYVQNAIDQTIDEAVSKAQLAKVYELKNIVLSKNTDATAAARDYGNTIARILTVDGPKANALEIAFNAFEKQDMTLLKQIDPINKSYKTILTKMAATPVPQALIQEHLNLLNGMSMIEHMTDTLRNISKDPMQTIVALDSHSKAEELSTTALINIKSYLIGQGITYKNTDPGIFFMTANLALE